MELILISASKLKVMLSSSDMRQYDMTDNDIDCSSTNTRKAIRCILNKVSAETGFDTSGEGIFVQLFTSRNGGCEMFITRSSSDGQAVMCNDLPENGNKQSDKAESGKVGRDERALMTVRTSPKFLSEKGKRPSLSFSFTDLDALTAVCRRLKGSGFSSESNAYVDDEGIYYLILHDTGISAYTRLDKLTFILEYGKRERTDSLLIYISEHGKVLRQYDAVEVLGEL